MHVGVPLQGRHRHRPREPHRLDRAHVFLPDQVEDFLDQCVGDDFTWYNDEPNMFVSE
jgi:hypothetical protein